MRRRAATAALATLAAGDALAHAPIAGAGPFLSGALHALSDPASLIALVLVGLWLARLGLENSRREAALMAAALAAGLVGALALRLPPAPDAVLLGAAVALGLVLALQLPLPPPAAWPLLGLMALLLGLALAAEDGTPTPALALAGSVAAALLVPAWVAVVAQQARAAWARIALRVMASWLSAAALLVLALQLFARRG